MNFAKSLLIVFILLVSCTEGPENIPIDPNEFNENSRGSGFFAFNNYEPFEDKAMNVYYHIPENATVNSEILFVFHGNGRNAQDYRNAMIAKANQYNFIVIAPKFSNQDFPGGDSYNLGNVFIDGDNPSISSLNPEQEWTFSVVEPLFDFVRDRLNNNTLSYNIFGHSAGGQFVHRFALFKPNARYNRMVASASGWYTVTDFNITFPYGLQNSPLENIDLENLFQRDITIQIGDLDNDPNAPALRQNEFANAQGLNRLARANHFYDEALTLANQNNFNYLWELEIIPNLDHYFNQACVEAADLIFGSN
jgi:pimeloyl-ACP methyl ester carboxylesterase